MIICGENQHYKVEGGSASLHLTEDDEISIDIGYYMEDEDNITRWVSIQTEKEEVIIFFQNLGQLKPLVDALQEGFMKNPLIKGKVSKKGV